MILIVDDDASVREMLRRVLTGEGYPVAAAADGAEAIRIAAAERIDLVLLDLNLPDMSGWDTLGRLISVYPALAVIVITARSGRFPAARGAGFGALLEKPLDFPTLLRTVAELLAEPAETRLARRAGGAPVRAPGDARPGPGRSSSQS
jgi:CheY-like chemotaxis protein